MGKYMNKTNNKKGREKKKKEKHKQNIKNKERANGKKYKSMNRIIDWILCRKYTRLYSNTVGLEMTTTECQTHSQNEYMHF